MLVPIKLRQYAGGVIGIIVMLLGLLWFLQGTGILHLCPVLCLTDCACLAGKSFFWGAMGVSLFISGILIIGISCKGRITRSGNEKA